LICDGGPVRVSICHCLCCQQRTGSVFGTQARFRSEEILTISGSASRFSRTADNGNAATFHFCPNCGATVCWQLSAYPELTVVALGAFADPQFPPPQFSVFEARRHDWCLLAEKLNFERSQ
jgi:hypothetical protein